MNEGKRRGTVVKRVHSFDQEICTYVWVTLCTLEKDDFFHAPCQALTHAHPSLPVTIIPIRPHLTGKHRVLLLSIWLGLMFEEFGDPQ